MAYQNGTYTDPTDLLQKLVTWLVGLGYTQDMALTQVTGGYGTGWRAHLHKGDLYVHLFAAVSASSLHFSNAYYEANKCWGICLYVSSSFDADKAFHHQHTGAPHGYGYTTSYVGQVFLNLGSAAGVAYHFIDDGDHIRVITERQAGVFGYLMWGPEVEKYGAWTGGRYFLGSTAVYGGSSRTYGVGVLTTAGCPSSGTSDSGLPPSFYLRADVDTFTGLWLSNDDNGGMPGSASEWTGLYTGRRVHTPALNLGQPSYGPSTEIPGYPQAVVDRLTSQVNGQTLLLPLTLYAQRDGGGWSPLGVLPGVCASNATRKGYAPGSTSLIGAETWQHFPNFSVRRPA